jgi:hypothetical protein
LREAPFIGEQPERSGVLREKETCAGVVTLFKDRRRKLSGAAIASVDGNSRLFAVLFNERADEGLVPP